MKRALTALVVGAATVAATGLAAPALATSPALGTSHSAAARVTPGSGLAPSVSTGGALGGLLDFLTPVLDQVVNPLTSQLTSLPGELVGDLAAGLTGAGFAADSASTARTAPADGYPTCGSDGWSDSNCFGPVVPTVAAAPLVTVGTGTVQGYASADDTGSSAKARTAGIVLSALGIPLGTLGVAEASSTCTAAGTCAGKGSLTGLNLLNGTVLARTDDDGSLQVAVNGGAYAGLSGLTSPATVDAGAVHATVQSQDGMLRVAVGLTLDQLLTTLGITASLADLNATDAGSTVSLVVTVGAGSTTSGGSATASGLRIGLGLEASVSISVLGLLSADVHTTNGAGNLLNLDLAYTSAKAAEATDPSGAPPDLT